jgi:hypothetical protein
MRKEGAMPLLDPDAVELALYRSGYRVESVPLGRPELGHVLCVQTPPRADAADQRPGRRLDATHTPKAPVMADPFMTQEDPAADGSVGDEAGLSLEEAAGRILDQVEALEADRSQLDGRLLDAYGALHTVLGEQYVRRTEWLAGPDGGRESVAAAAVSVEDIVIDEVITATAVPFGEASRRLRVARSPRRYSPLRARLGSGTVALLHVTMIAEGCAAHAVAEDLTDAEHDALVELVTGRVLAPMPDGSRPTHTQVRDRLARVLRSLQDPTVAAGRRARARQRRGLYATVTEDGMGVLSLHTSAEHVVAIMDRIEHLARAMRQAGDPRNLNQLRADLAAEALLRHEFGPCSEHATTQDAQPPTTQDAAPSATQGAQPSSPAQGAQPSTTAGGQLSDPSHQAPIEPDPPHPEPSEPEPAEPGSAEDQRFGAREDDPPPGPCGCAPPAPQASAWIVVPFEVVTGMSDAACELPGHGWVTAEHARDIITAPGSVWKWLAIDHLTGRAIELGTDTYRPTPAMVEQVRALDGHCRAPGCTVPAARCDVDHHIPHPDGPTESWNLGPLHRGHHNRKTCDLLRCVPEPVGGDPSKEQVGSSGCAGCDGCRDGAGPDEAATLASRTGRGLAWRTLSGREYITYPKSWTEALRDYDHPEHIPPTRAALAQTAAAERAKCEAAERDRRYGWDQPPPF